MGKTPEAVAAIDARREKPQKSPISPIWLCKCQHRTIRSVSGLVVLPGCIGYGISVARTNMEAWSIQRWQAELHARGTVDQG